MKKQQVLYSATVGAGCQALLQGAVEHFLFFIPFSLLVEGVTAVTFCSHPSFCNLTASDTATAPSGTAHMERFIINVEEYVQS